LTAAVRIEAISRDSTISARSGEGPAPAPGSRLLSQVPRGVIARTDSTRSSMWV
jgi:hypothetical protein